MSPKIKTIIYWVATLWLALGMVSTGAVQVLQIKEQIDPVIALGYPAYFLLILGVAKILGVIAVLLPKLPLLKEWAYAGFVFMMAGAIISHVAMGDAAGMFPALLLLVLTGLSWYFRPASRQLLNYTV
ncbi:DoxX family protein [Chitinophaga sedimenti]|uniref:DoxX family protein n=1 Tax=Chitinophaga sedimenti TaxID=2033606 RepID=UPI0020050056|nr:DoxX family protein [Chitinophaga sedimenti]MCK7554883.1 DoxX family protein [Chitinophaga sedimenti]